MRVSVGAGEIKQSIVSGKQAINLITHVSFEITTKNVLSRFFLLVLIVLMSMRVITESTCTRDNDWLE